MATLARLDVILGLQTTGFNKGLRRMQAKLRRTGRQLQSTGSSLTRSITVPLGLAGAAAVKMAVDFEDSMGKIESLVGRSSQQVEQWSQQLLDLGPKVGRGPKELADAMFFITSAGLDGQVALDALTASAQASAAGLGETAVVADAVTSAMNAYGQANLDAAQAASVLVAAVKEGKASAEELAPVLGGLLPFAAELGVEFHEVGAGIAALTRVGATASEAATSLRSLFVGIIKPASQSREAINNLGLTVDQLRTVIREKGILAALALLAEKMEGNVDALGQVFPNQRALTAVLNATGEAAEETAGIFARMATVTKDVLAEAFRIASEKAKFSLEAALARVQATMIRLGDAVLPRLLPLVDQLAKVIEDVGVWFASLDEDTQGLILGFATFAGIIGPLLTALGGVALLLAGLTASMIGWTAAIVAGGALIVKNWDAIKAAVVRFIDFARPALEYFQLLLADLWGDVKETAERIWPDVQRIFQNVVDAMVGIWIDHGDKLKTIIKAAVIVIKTTLNLVLGAVEVITAFLAGDWGKAWAAAKRTAKQAFKGIATAGEILWLNLKAGMNEMVATFLEGVNQMIKKTLELARAFIELPFISPIARAASKKGLELLEDAMGGINTAAEGARDRAKELRNEAIGLAGPLTKSKQVLVEMQSEWVNAADLADKSTTATVERIDSAGKEIQGKLTGGFGKGIEEGVDQGREAFQNFKLEVEG